MFLKKFIPLFATIFSIIASCNSNNTQTSNGEADKSFATFENIFLDNYWKQYPDYAIFLGYGKYYDKLVTPDSVAISNNINFSNLWIDSLSKLDFAALNDNNKISFNIIRHQLETDIWYASIFKEWQWNPANYNIAASCDYVINQPYAPLDERLRILTRRIQSVDAYYKAALKMLFQPTKEHLDLAIMQNEGGVSVFGPALTDSINASALTTPEKDELKQNIVNAIKAINEYVDGLKAIAADKKYVYRSFSIGKKLFAEKFKYDLATDLTPEQVYEKAIADKKMYHERMFVIAGNLWSKYYETATKPTDSFILIRSVLDKIALQHATARDFFDSLTSQVHQLKKFIKEKDLFDFDTSATPIVVRFMPGYARGVASASAEFVPPYQQAGATYYNIDDLTKYPAKKAEQNLRDDNKYASTFLSIHEAIPGHCMQGIYNNKKSPDVLRSVFANGAMVEGWAVYTERMMFENGWGNNAPEIELELCKLNLRELANVLIDYDIQCLNKTKEDILQLLTKECFQSDEAAESKYHRATVSQVQLCSYFTGEAAIKSLREEYKKKMGDKYTLKDFHEKFLSFGSSPVKYIRERMLQ